MALGFSESRIITPADAEAFRLTMRATIEPSPDKGGKAKLKLSEVPKTRSPAPLTVNVPLENAALPVKPTEPTSASSQPGAKAVVAITVKGMGLLAFMPGATETDNGP